MKKLSKLLGLSLFVLTTAALAGPAGDAAQAHFKAVGEGDVDAIMSQYGDKATLYWVGGPLNGDYNGSDAIKGIWSKFTKGQGPLQVKVSELTESKNDKGSTVMANVGFQGKNTIKVRYVLTYRDGKLVAETWQIDPALKVGY
jgi:ketosteroid isomerase-like protein